MHRLLLRQLKKFWPQEDISEAYEPFLKTVNEAYIAADDDRSLIERSLELTSAELFDRNVLLREKLDQLEKTRDELQGIVATIQATFDSTREGVFSLDTQSQKVSCNRVGRFMLNLPMDQSIFPLRQCLKALVKKVSSQQLQQDFHNPNNKSKKTGEIFFTTGFNSGEILEVYSVPKIQEGTQIGRVWCVRDTTAYHNSQRLIEHQANHDTLTNLPNRNLLRLRAEHAISLARRDEHMIAVLFLDLDHFKKVNDSAGHQVGDLLLKNVSERIRSHMREGDTLARIGGDEFVVLVEKVTSSGIITQMAKRIQESTQIPFEISGASYFIGCSIGISLYPRDALTIDELLRKADMSMYHAKESGRSTFKYFDESLERFAVHQMSLERDLRIALGKSEFSLVYQPKIALQKGGFTSAEALMRWTKNGKLISPVDFIPVAEQTGLIHDVSRWVLDQVCRQLRAWLDAGLQPPAIAVNISSLNINDRQFADFMESTLLKYNLPGKNLEFEITESVLLESTRTSEDFIKRAKNLGIQFSMDDFGTGYSSLSYLHKLPINTIKIDKSFIIDLLEEEHNQAITNTIIVLAKALKLNVVAEGVETQQVHDWLVTHQCDYAQGYYYHRPLSTLDFTALLHPAKK